MSAKKGEQPTSTVSVRLGDNMKKILEAIAYEERRTVSSLLGRLIEQHIRTYEPRLVAKALGAAEVRQREQATEGPYGDPFLSFMEEVARAQKQPLDKALDKAIKKK
jgi:hypothetical protein